MNELQNLGWNDTLACAFVELADVGFLPARVSAQEREGYKVICRRGEVPATLAGRFHHRIQHTEDIPAVGDWVAVTLHDGFARIHALLPRRTLLRRKLSNERIFAPQVVAANFDTVFITTSANRDFNVRRLERLLTLVWESGASPVVLITKIDLVDDASPFVEEAAAVAWGAEVHALSAHEGIGCDVLDGYRAPGKTLVMLGTSGVGKSTLTNLLLGEQRMYVQTVRADDDRGRHTTSSRNLLPLPGGGAIIDTPGLRAVALWASDDGVEAAFGDIQEIAAECRFNDCGHAGEPGCAVADAIANGHVDPERFAAYQKLQREVAFVRRKENRSEAANTKKKWKQITKDMRKRNRWDWER
ncbi:MAG: ribosome small subunit-dependent GTPase A [Planctomycetota bacterium]